MRKLLLYSIITLNIFSIYSFAQVGKISGVVKDGSTGETLIGANVLLEGTTIGAATNIDGYYSIINVPPGTYSLKATMVGYAPGIYKDVRVSIDQTTEINFGLTSNTFQTDEVVVIATTPIVQKDVASSRVNFNVEEIQNLPVSSISGVIGLQAGVRSGLEIRGGAATQTAFLVNGVTMRDERDNSPFTGISYSAIDEVQIQTGGFNAEYGNVRSGLINVVTKEGLRDKYSFSLITRYSGASPKHFGMSANDPNSYWIRPYVDPDVAWTGTTNGNWDAYTQLQYPTFDGWINIAQKRLSDDDPTNDITPEQAQQIFLWQHRRITEIQEPDYEVDASFGGPIPFAQDLGALRFFASYRQTQTMYIVPLSRDGVNDWVGQLKLTSDIGEGKKLMVQGLISQVTGTNSHNRSNAGVPGIFKTAEDIGNLMNRVNYINARLFSPDYWSPAQIDYSSFSGKFTNVINPNTFYEVSLSSFTSQYGTYHGRERNTEKIYNVGGILLDEAPYGFVEYPSDGIDGLRMGVGFSNYRDSSRVSVYSTKFDYQTQLDRFNNLKAGAEIAYTDNHVDYSTYDAFLESNNSISKYNNYPIRGALYVQDKLEFEGMVANIGLRLDYSDPQGEWYDYDVYDEFLTAKYASLMDSLITRVTIDKQINLSPRVGISFPISVNSKLFFNYGHFRQLPTPDNLFLLRRYSATNSISRIANPNNPFPKTVAYELGYEHNLLDVFLVRVAGYYKDVSLQSYLVEYQNEDQTLDYFRAEPNSYQDVRGFEFTLSKNRGDWIQGFINYTYDVRTSGVFGFDIYYQNKSEQRKTENTSRDNYQEKPVPRPFANLNLDFFTPSEYGPKVGGLYPLADWRMSLVTSWTAGRYITWTNSASIAGIENNAQWNPYWNVDLRISKTLNILGINLQVFADISNLFNYKYMTEYGFVNASDYTAYMKSLHLPENVFDSRFGYVNVTGDDRPGDYRTGPYIPWDENASESQKDEWRKNKSYIDMPNQEFFTFLNPRDIFWGLKLSFDF